MNLDFFYYGGFTSSSPVVEYSGSNEDDILTWANELAPLNNPWIIQSIDRGRSVTFSNDTNAVTVNLYDWISASPYGLNIVDKEGHWKADKYGKPFDLNDLEA